MGLDVPLNTYTGKRLTPLYDAEDAITIPVNIAPNTTLALGTVLGQVSNSANDVQTMTVTGTPTSGAMTVSGTNPITGGSFSFSVPYNGTASGVQANVNAAVGSGNLAVGGGALPGSALTFTAAGAFAGMPLAPMSVSASTLNAGATAAFAHTTVGRSANTFAAYNDANSDGTQTAKAVLPFDIATDAAGNITLGTTASGGEWGETLKSISVYVSGYFSTADLVGLDTNGVADLGKLVAGTLSAGVLRIS